MSEFCEEYKFHGVDVYHLIVDMAEEGIWILNPGDVLVFMNKKLLSMLGYSKEELLCHNVFDIIAGEDREIVEKALDRRHKGVKEIYVVRLRKKDSGLLWVAVAAAPIMDKEGNYNGVVSLASDISIVKQGEEALKKEKSLATMYLDLMAHDINNLNQVAIGNLELAIDELQQKKPEDHEILDFLKKSMDTMCQQTALIKNVKTLQQLKTEQLRYEDVDLGEIIAEAVRDYPKIPGREVTIYYEKPGKCFVKSNLLLKAVFTNLIGNSVKHSTGAVRIWITVDSAMEQGKKYYEVTVADDGPGIPDDMKERLFRRFKSEGDQASGHGLGLYLVKAIVEDFGGRVQVGDRVRGDYARGAKFVVLLPASIPQ
jgi:PAS domain S-box-containing protein